MGNPLWLPQTELITLWRMGTLLTGGVWGAACGAGAGAPRCPRAWPKTVSGAVTIGAAPMLERKFRLFMPRTIPASGCFGKSLASLQTFQTGIDFLAVKVVSHPANLSASRSLLGGKTFDENTNSGYCACS